MVGISIREKPVNFPTPFLEVYTGRAGARVLYLYIIFSIVCSGKGSFLYFFPSPKLRILWRWTRDQIMDIKGSKRVRSQPMITSFFFFFQRDDNQERFSVIHIINFSNLFQGIDV